MVCFRKVTCWVRWKRLFTQGSIKKGVLKNFANFTGKRRCWSLFLIILQGLKPATFLKRDSNTGVFLWKANFLEHLFWRTSANNCFCIMFFKVFSECKNIIFYVMCWTSGHWWKNNTEMEKDLWKNAGKLLTKGVSYTFF